MQSMMKRICLLLGMAGAMFAGAAAAAAAGPEIERAIRVGLTYRQEPESVLISGKGAWEARNFNEAFEGEARITAGRGELVLETTGRHGGVGPWIELWPAAGAPWLTMDGSRYRGKLRVELSDGGRLKVVNTLGIEDYVRGVVPNEMFAQPEAFKVQAVVSRTYGMYVRDIEKKHEDDGFDICTTGHCQVYRGASTETALSDAAVRSTRGEVVIHRGRPIFAAYHANAGRRTQTVDEAWPGSIRKDFLYLESVESPYDAAATDLRGYEWCYRWRRWVTERQIQDRLRERGRYVGEIERVVVRAKTSTGRMRRLEIIGREGTVRLGTLSEARAVLGTPSALFEVRGVGRRFELTGWGRGHGVGMSQHGALGMAKAGYSYPQILGHFYRGVALVEEYGKGASRELSPPELKVKAANVAPAMVPEGRS